MTIVRKSIILCVTLLAACSNSTPPPSTVASVDGSVDVGSQSARPLKVATAPESPPVPEPPVPEAPKRAKFVAGLEGILAAWGKREAALVKDYDANFTASVDRLRWFKRLTNETYAARDFKPAFSQDGRLTESADALVDALHAVSDHGLDPKPYALSALDTHLAEFRKAATAYSQTLVINDDEKPVWDFVSQLRRSAAPSDGTDLAAKVSAADFRDGDIPKLDAVGRRLAAMFDAKEALNTALRELDVALMWRLYRYVYDMRYAKRAHPFHADRDDVAGVTRTADALKTHVDGLNFEQLAPALAQLVPQLPDYQKTKAGLAFYRKLAAEKTARHP